MSGHSKWANIKHRKAAQDSKRAKVWTKILKEITISARHGGGDPDANPRLRTAVIAARTSNIPNDTLQRAIKKGTGELEGVNYEEILYEGYGPYGIALMLEIMTDNRQRTVAEIRHLLSKHGGNLGESGSVAWNFTRKGNIVIDSEQVSEDDLIMKALDAGAVDVKREGDSFSVLCEPSDFNDLHEALKKDFSISHAEIEQIPGTTVKIETVEEATKFMKLYEMLEDHDDVQKVWDNSEIPEAVMEQLNE
ncbi:MAG: YebC/PmpR family DNA-binding transcriptional regulator [Candidatus Neomarinimicrobiota bacterium]|jgi:YebC/PmpR family DNA-binding regulatory protein|nr:YebC/PmpR family DNA-binding transcriptional regulator [Candidatus Neomarinimicrobiota bacterium]MDD3965552.1 YebC/PmpR family DNA-binding transcriptional regulator [Candidatus Neomarinimicrobiota bacterium]